MKQLIAIIVVVITFMSSSFSVSAHTLSPENQPSSLDGEWVFYHEKLMSKGIFEQGKSVQIPSSFQKEIGIKNTYGTYVRTWQVPKEWRNHRLAVHIPFEYSAYAFYVDGEKLVEAGQVGPERQHETMLAARTAYFIPTKSSVTFQMEMSSFHHIRGGFENSIYIGNQTAIDRHVNAQFYRNAIMTGLMFMMGLLMLIFAWFLKDLREFFVFGLFCLSFATRSFFAVPFLYEKITSISYVWATKMEYFWTLLCFAIFIYLMKLYYEQRFSKWIVHGVWSICGFLMLMTLTTPPVVFQTLFFKLSWTMLPVFGYLLYIMMCSVRSSKWVSRLHMIGVAIVFSGVILDYLKGSGIITVPLEMTMPAVSIYLLLQLIAIAKDFAKGRTQLIKLNTSLDEEVALRTKQLEEKNEQLALIAWQDSLTGIANRRYFNEKIDERFQYAQQSGENLSLIMLDVDEFKQYNDYYGHVAGDRLLKKFAALINEVLPQHVLFARYGGEEFVLVTAHNAVEAKAFAEMLRQHIEEAKLAHLGRKVKQVTASFGVRTYTNETTADELVNKADELLYLAKASGRNCVQA